MYFFRGIVLVFKINFFTIVFISTLMFNDLQSSYSQDREILYGVIEHGIEHFQEGYTRIRQALERLSNERNISEKQRIILQFYLAKMQVLDLGESLYSRKCITDPFQDEDAEYKNTNFVRAEKCFHSIVTHPDLPKSLRAQACFYIAKINYEGLGTNVRKSHRAAIEALESLNLLDGHNADLLSESMYDEAMIILADSYTHACCTENQYDDQRKIYEYYERKNGMSCWTEEQQCKAKFILAEIYYRGLGEAERKDLSVALYEQCLVINGPEKKFLTREMLDQIRLNLTCMYYDGEVVEQDIPAAKKHLQSINGTLTDPALRQMVNYMHGNICFEEADYESALDFFEKAFMTTIKNQICNSLMDIINKELLAREEYNVLHNKLIENQVYIEQLKDELYKNPGSFEERRSELNRVITEDIKNTEQLEDLYSKMITEGVLKTLSDLKMHINNQQSLSEIFIVMQHAQKNNIHKDISMIDIFSHDKNNVEDFKFYLFKSDRFDLFFKLIHIYTLKAKTVLDEMAGQFIFEKLASQKTLAPQDRDVVDYFIAKERLEYSIPAKKTELLIKLHEDALNNTGFSKILKAKVRASLAFMKHHSTDEEELKEARNFFEQHQDDESLSPLYQAMIKTHLAVMQLNGQGGPIQITDALEAFYKIKDAPDQDQLQRNKCKFWIAKHKQNEKDKESLLEVKKYFEELINDPNLSEVQRIETSYVFAQMLWEKFEDKASHHKAYKLFFDVLKSPNAPNHLRSNSHFNIALMQYRGQEEGKQALQCARANFHKLEEDKFLSPQDLVLVRFYLAKMIFTGQGGQRNTGDAKKRFEYLVQDVNLPILQKDEAKFCLAIIYSLNASNVDEMIKAKTILNYLKDKEDVELIIRLKSRALLEKVAYDLSVQEAEGQDQRMQEIHSNLKQILKDLRVSKVGDKTLFSHLISILSKMHYLGHGVKQLPLADRTNFLKFINDEDYISIRTLLLALNKNNNADKISKTIDLMRMLHEKREREGLGYLSKIIQKIIQFDGKEFEKYKELLTVLNNDGNYNLLISSILLETIISSEEYDFNSMINNVNTIIENEIKYGALQPNSQPKLEQFFSLIVKMQNEELKDVLGCINGGNGKSDKKIEYETLSTAIRLYKQHGKTTFLRWLEQIDNLDPNYRSCILRSLNRVHKEKADNIMTYCFMLLTRESIDANRVEFLFKCLDIILPEDHNINDGFLENCRRYLTGEDRALAGAVCHFLDAFMQDLGLEENDEIIQLSAIAKFELTKENDSAYSLHAQLKAKKIVETEWQKLPRLEIGVNDLFLNHKGIKEFFDGFQIDYESAADVRAKDFIALLVDLKNNIERDQDLHHRVQNIIAESNQEITIAELIEEAGKPDSFFNLKLNSKKDRKTGPLKCVVGNLIHLPDHMKWRDLARLLSSARFCGVGKDGAIQDFYNGLPPEKRMKLLACRSLENGTIPKWSIDQYDEQQKPAWKIVHTVMQEYISNLFSSEAGFMRGLCDINSEETEINQAIHQMMYVKNLVGDLVGLNRKSVEFDFYIGWVYPKIKEMSQQEMLETYYMYFNIENFLKFMCTKVSVCLKNEMAIRGEYEIKPIYRGFKEILNGTLHDSMELEDDFTTFKCITRTGMIHILKKANVFVASRDYTNNDVEMRENEDDQNDSGRKRKHRDDSEENSATEPLTKRVNKGSPEDLEVV